MKKIMITGCNGQLGRALNQLYEKELGITIVNTDVFPGEGITLLDITDVDKVLSFVREVKPDAIINCAAHTNVDKCETDIDNAYKINAIGPRNLSIAATETGAKLMHVSTDYVFPGTENRALTEFERQGLSVYTERQNWPEKILCGILVINILLSGLHGSTGMEEIL